MAEPEPLIFPNKNPTLPPSKTQQTKTNFFSSFHFKAIFVIVLIALLPLFPSQAPDSILGHGWELIHLLLVGIAVSYGLFSRRNSDPELDKSPDHTPQSYVSKLLHVSSVFDDDDPDSPSTAPEENMQSWSSQYQRGDPMVVVADNDSDDKPLSLPVRSLKSIGSKETDGSSVRSRIDGSSIRSSSAGSFKARNDGDSAKESDVLPSPIPWRCRSGRIEVKDEILGFASPPISPKQEDTVKKKKFYKSIPPPPPPPPPLLPLAKPVKNLKQESHVTKPLIHTESATSSVPPRSVRTVRWKEELPDKADLIEEPPLKPSEDVIIANDDSDSDGAGDETDAEEASSSGVEGGKDDIEVDKKADEFIAKFREQIRLQRIESIKRSSGQRSGKKV